MGGEKIQDWKVCQDFTLLKWGHPDCVIFGRHTPDHVSMGHRDTRWHIMLERWAFGPTCDGSLPELEFDKSKTITKATSESFGSECDAESKRLIFDKVESRH